MSFPVIGPGISTISAIWSGYWSFVTTYLWFEILHYIVLVSSAIALFWTVFSRFQIK